ncbi:MAG: fibronectin type III domain-containing protein, partial [Oscillospiraceae bacterium]|nr:fibronectin type III domain-containing protein [Oscillospiraceae bacterium]
MKRKKLLRVMGCLLAIAMLAGIMVATVSADSPEIAFLNPLGEVEPVQNQPLVARLADLNGSRIRLLQYGAANSASQLAMASLQATLNAAGATALAPADFGGTVFDARTAAQYTTWATGVDAVVIGVVEDNLAAWWIGNHAKEIEARGVPVVVLTTDWFYSAVRAGAQDNGLAEMRIVSIPRAPWADAQGYAITGTPTPRRTYIDNNIVGGTVNIGTAVKAALTDPLTVAELSAAPLTVEDMGIPYADGRATISVPGANAVEALPAFYELSMDLGFGDGMPLMIPTQEAVDAMIAGQGADGREADEVLGKVMLRGGIMTVEKIAANAVMAGARPQHFSTILAVMEAYATGWEDNKLFYREIMSIDQRTLVMIVSGPIVGTGAGQLDLSRGRMLDPGKDDSAVIGRAVMLAIRNIGHIAFERSAVIGAGSRLKPHELFVMAEASEYLPAGWVTLSEHMGFGANSNTVTLLSVNQTRFNGDVGGTAAGGYGGTFDNIGGAYRTQGTATNLFNSPGIFVVHWRDANYAASTDTRPRQDGGLSTAARGISSKSMLQQFIVGTGGSVTENGPSPTTNIVRNQAREALVWPIVAGYGHSTTTRVFHAASADYNNSRGFQTQRIGGQSSPSAPLNAKAKVSADGTKAWLKWDAPARLGGGTITGYEISCNDGKTWEDVGLVNEFTVTGLKYAPSDQHRIWVRAKTDVLNSTDVRAPGVDGPNAHLDWRASGRGAWASADVKIEII